ncbi:MAG TPA: hypothetical protein V6D23_24025, partial [Candidatus Obscuribacterales bacterium]
DMGAPPVGPAADWTRLSGGPYAGIVKDLVRDQGKNVFVATEGGGVFVSVDSGQNWSEYNTGLGDLNVTRLASNPNNASENIYAGTADGRVFRRNFMNSDATWVQVGSDAVTPNNKSITMLYVDPLTLKRVFAGGSLEGVFEYADPTFLASGWTDVNDGDVSGTKPVTGMVKDIGLGDFYLSVNGEGVYKTTNQPGTDGWQLVNNSLGDTQVASLNIDQNSNLQLGTENGRFYSTNTGAINWVEQDNGLGSSRVEDVIAKTNLIYAATPIGLKVANDANAPFGEPDGGIWVGTNGVGSAPHPPDKPASPFVYALLNDPYDASSVLIGTTGAGVNKWNQSTSTWTYRNEGLRTAHVSAFLKAPAPNTQLFSATRGAGVFTSDDTGGTWEPMQNIGISGLERMATLLEVRNQVSPPGTYDLFMGTYSGVFFLDDAFDGMPATTSWTSLNTGLNNNSVRALLLLPNDLLLAGTEQGANGGVYIMCAPGSFTCTTPTTWVRTGSGNGVNEGLCFELKPGTTDHVYAGGQQTVYVNDDLNGIGTWTASNSFGNGDQFVTALATSLDDPDVVYAGLSRSSSATQELVWKKSSAANTYVKVGDLPPGVDSVTALAVNPADADMVIAGTNTGAYVSTDGGTTWSAFNAGSDNLSGVAVTELQVVGSDLYAGTSGKSLFKMDLSTLF